MIEGMETSNTKLLPLRNLARTLHVPARWLREEAEAGRIPALRAGRNFLFELGAVESALLARARESAPGKGVPE